MDTAAEGGLIGTRALDNLQCELGKHGLKCHWTPKTSSAKGVGGQAVVCGVVLIPMGIGGINGVLEATVVEGDVLLLLPIRLLKALNIVIDIPNLEIMLGTHDVKISMRELPSGHLVIPVTNFSSGPFQCPSELGSGVDFVKHESNFVAAMQAQSRFNSKPAPHGGESRSALTAKCNGPDCPAHSASCPGDSGVVSSRGQSAGNETHGGQPAEGAPQLEGHSGQDMHVGNHGGTSRRRWRLVPTVLGTGVCALASSYGGGHLCGADHWCPTSGTAEIEGAAESGSQRMRPLQEQAQGWGRGKPLSVLGDLQGLPLPLEYPLQGYGSSPRGEREAEGLLGSSGDGPRCDGVRGDGTQHGGSGGDRDPDLEQCHEPDGESGALSPGHHGSSHSGVFGGDVQPTSRVATAGEPAEASFPWNAARDEASDDRHAGKAVS